MRARLVLSALLVLVLGGAGVWAFRHYRRPAPLVLSGTVEARDVQVGSLLGGRVVAVHVEEGARVTKGQPLVSFETDLIDLQLREQNARVDEARAALARVLKGPRDEERARARVEWENAERERKRLAALLAEGIVGQQQYDETASREATTREGYRQLERGSRPEDIAAARASLEREEGRLHYLLRQREEAVVRAPVEGIIESLDLRPGDLVSGGRPVASLLEPHQLWVRVYVPETKLGLVRVGQQAILSVDTYPGRTFPGRVVEISDRAEYTPRNVQTLDQRSDQVFGVKVAIDPSPEIKAGMAALVRLAP